MAAVSRRRKAEMQYGCSTVQETLSAAPCAILSADADQSVYACAFAYDCSQQLAVHQTTYRTSEHDMTPLQAVWR
jgi:hypothetical protein